MEAKEITLSELLTTDFIIVDNKMLGTFTLDRINMISDVLKQQKEEIEKLNNIINKLSLESYLGMIENQNNNDYSKGLYTAYKYINDKLKELKGENNG